MSTTEITLASRPQLVSYARRQWDPVREKQVILLPESVLALNATAIAILDLCDGQRNVAEIAATLSEQYGRDGRALEQDVLTFLQRLASKGLLDTQDEQGK